MPVLVAYETYHKTYRANKVSGACICYFVTYFFAFLMPFLLCILTNNFWQYYSIGSDTIKYKFREQYLMYVLENDQSKVFSNLRHFDENLDYKNQLIAPSFESVSLDYNVDGIPDSFQASFEFVSDANKISQCFIVLFFDAQLKEDTNVVISGQLKFDLFARGGISNARLYSRINLKQRKPIPKVNFQKKFYETNVFEENNYDIIQSLLEYERRDYILEPDYQEVITGGENYDRSKIQLEIQLDNNQQILYETRTLGLLKFAWIQYLSLLIPFWYLARAFLRFTLRYRFFYARKYDNLPKTIEDY